MIYLLHYAKKYRKQIILGPIFKFLEAVFELVLPLFMAYLVDHGIQRNNGRTVVEMAIWMALMSIVGLICAIICQYYASIASQGFGTELRNELLKKINTFSHAELDYFGTDTLITRMTNDINQLQLALAMVIRLLIRAPFLSVGSVVMAFIIDWQAGLFFLMLLPIFALILYFIIKKTIPLYQKVQQKLDSVNESVSQNLSGIRVIRAFARTKTETRAFDQQADDLSSTYLRVSNISALLTPATTLIMNLGIICLLSVGGIKVNIGTLQQGQVLALINYMNQMLLALIVVSNLVVIFTRAEASGNRVKEVLVKESMIVDPAQSFVPVEKSSAIIQFDHVDFRYTKDAGLALKDLTFSIERKSVVGIIGPTGSGKSTLIQLIPRFYDISNGEVRVDGLDVRQWALADLRQKVAIVPQTSVLFTGTIRENLQWGKEDATDEECWQALMTAQAADFVRQLPEGLDTLVMENGKNFSGGQKQRLTIARALIAKPEILILDDSLSALDYQTDLDLRKALQADLDCTVLIISQRIRSIQEAETILVMDRGAILAQGTHQTLLAQSAEYQAIAASQEDE